SVASSCALAIPAQYAFSVSAGTAVRHEREHEREPAAPALSRFDEDVSAVVAGDLAGQEKPEAGPVDVRVRRRDDPAEPGEQAPHLRLGNAEATVLDADEGAPALLSHQAAHNTAFRHVLDRVVQEIREHRLDAAGVAGHDERFGRMRELDRVGTRQEGAVSSHEAL